MLPPLYVKNFSFWAKANDIHAYGGAALKWP